MLCSLLFATGFSVGEMPAASMSDPLCNATDLWESFDLDGQLDFWAGRIRNNLTCSTPDQLYKCEAWKFCYYQLVAATQEYSYGFHSTNPFCIEQDGNNILDPSAKVPDDIAAGLATGSDLYNYFCECADSVSGESNTATAHEAKTECKWGKAFHERCGNLDGTVSNKAQLTDDMWAIQGENVIYWNRNFTNRIHQSKRKCNCRRTEDGSNEINCELSANWNGEYCHEASGECSVLPQCAIDTELFADCQCGSSQCHYKKREGRHFCHMQAAENTFVDPTFWCARDDLRNNINAYVLLSIIVPATILAALIVTCGYYVWWFNAIKTKLA